MKYSVILADPAWSYRDKCHAGKRGVGYKYDTMSIDDIKSLPVSDIAADNAVLFLWVTWPLLQDGIDTMNAWGFRYKTVGFVWVKTNRKSGSPFMGMGNWTRSNSEICLMGVRGKPKRVDAGVHSVVLAPIREHSRKPDEVRERIEKLMGEVPRVELFARQTADGWDSVGNGIDGQDIREWFATRGD